MAKISRLIIIPALLAAVLLIALGFRLGSNQYQSLSAGVQAAGVIIALTLGVSTLMSDSKGRRVDRVIDFQAQMSGGELQLARQRLIEYLNSKSSGSTLPIIPWEELRLEAGISPYTQDIESPIRDAQRLLEYFEGAWGARCAGATDETLLFELLGGYVTWWGRAFSQADTDLARALHEFEKWVYQRAERVPHDERVTDWAKSIDRDFGTAAGN